MGMFSKMEKWNYYFSDKTRAIEFFNHHMERYLLMWDGFVNDANELFPRIIATPSHIIVSVETDIFLHRDADTDKEHEVWYSYCDFIETHECTRIYNPNK